MSRVYLKGLLDKPLKGPTSDVYQPPCALNDSAIWFPVTETPESTEQAKNLCHTCKIMDSCLADALERDDRNGVWGGMSTPERRALKKELVAV